MSGIAQTLTQNVIIVLGRSDATVRPGPKTCVSTAESAVLKHAVRHDRSVRNLAAAYSAESKVEHIRGCILEQYDDHGDEERRNSMVNYWERVGLLGPIYRLIGRGLNDHEIAARLNITEVNVNGCIAWLTHFLNCTNRTELIDYASASLPSRRDLRAA